MDNTIVFHSTEYSDLWILFRWIVVRHPPPPSPPPPTPLYMSGDSDWTVLLKMYFEWHKKRQVYIISESNMFITAVCVLFLISIFFPWSQFRRDFSLSIRRFWGKRGKMEPGRPDTQAKGILNLTTKPPAPPPFNRGLLGGSSRAVLLKSCKAVFLHSRNWR